MYGDEPEAFDSLEELELALELLSQVSFFLTGQELTFIIFKVEKVKHYAVDTK